MASNVDGVSPRSHGNAAKVWDARPNVEEEESTLDEEAPLLGSGSPGRDGHATRDIEHEWEGAADFLGVSWWKTPSMYWLLPIFFLFALAFGGIIVPKLNLILSLVCREYLFDRSQLDPNFVFAPVLLEGDNAQCRIPEVQQLVSKFMLWISFITGSCSAVMAPKLGALSDRYGRKPFMIVSSGGLFCTEIITILVYKYPDALSYRWLLAGAVLDGVSGSFTVGMALTNAYGTDCTPPPKRAVVFGYFQACLFTGIALGPLLAALLIKAYGELIIIFYVALAVHTFYIFFIAFVVPESLSKKRQVLARERYTVEREAATHALGTVGGGQTLLLALSRGNILAPLKILWPTGPGSSSQVRRNLVLIASVDTIIFGIAMGGMTVIVYYMGYQFGWDTAGTSVFISSVNTVRVLGLIILLPLLNYLVRTRRANRQRRESGYAVPERNSGCDSLDLYIIRGAIFVELLGFIGYSLVRTGGLFLVCGVFASLGGIGSPTLQSALTKHVPSDRVGQVLGAMALLHALARIVSPVIFNAIYILTVKPFPQAVFVVLAACFGTAFIVSWFIKPHVYLEDANETTGNPAREATGAPTSDSLVDEEIGGY